MVKRDEKVGQIAGDALASATGAGNDQKREKSIGPYRLTGAGQGRTKAAARKAQVQRTVSELQKKPYKVSEDGPRLWEQLPGEPDNAYRRFCLFRDLGPTRTLEELCRMEGLKVDVSGKRRLFPGSILMAKKDYMWTVRVDAYDDYARERLEERTIIESGMEVWQDRSVALRERQYNLGEMLLKLAEKRALAAAGLRVNGKGEVEEDDDVEEMTAGEINKVAILAKAATQLMGGAIIPHNLTPRQPSTSAFGNSPAKRNSAEVDLGNGGGPKADPRKKVLHLDGDEEGNEGDLPLLPTDLTEATDAAMQEYMQRLHDRTNKGSRPQTPN